jgi:hypothetical protein
MERLRKFKKTRVRIDCGSTGRAIAQVVSRWLPKAVALGRA